MAEGTLAQPAYVARLSTALQANVAGASVASEKVRGERYRFIVVAEQFEGQDHPLRQRTVWDVADRTLPKEDLVNVAMIITLSPSEL